jgi:zinc/manganese transport system ATP-binding protein
MNAIEFRDVALTLGGRLVLDGIGLDVGHGEFVGVLGPNGSGKTTLLRAILGLVTPSRGTIRVLGRPVGRSNPEIGYMPQTHGTNIAARITARDFLASALRGYRIGLPITGRRDRAEIDRVLHLVDADALARRPLAELSGGERQRLLLAQALMGEPRLLLLDEPLISLDPRHQREVVELVNSLRHELGVTVLFSAHELNPLLGAIDRVLYLGRGQAALGTVEDVITGPVLSRLYGSEIEVVRLNRQIFVLSAGQQVERDEHRHENEPERVHSGHV